MPASYPKPSDDETFALAINVIAWALTDPRRAQRMLALTGLDPDTLRDLLDSPATLRALLDFVLDHEPDLIACAQEIGVKPGDIAEARRRIGA